MAAAAIGMSKTVVVVSADAALRRRLCASLSGMRWHVRDASGGADAMAQVEEQPAEAVLLDSWLPDLEVGELAARIEGMFPEMDVLRLDGRVMAARAKSPRRHELLHAMREAADGVDSVGSIADVTVVEPSERRTLILRPVETQGVRLDELIGQSAPMLELSRLVRLVAPRHATVLIEGETGTGKEVVAKAVHRLSSRAQKPFVVLNCAAIPESLLEAELFGHTRGAFTGAVHARMGRMEAAHGGTLFLDEIGEMPIQLQAKMLRFLECGEIQRVGENDTTRVDVRVIAATHQPLERRAVEGTFRLDLYHRLAVFPVEVPPLRERAEDIEALTDHFLSLLGRDTPRKSISSDALAVLKTHGWPGNVRELAHVLERATILAGDMPMIGPDEIRLRRVAQRFGASKTP